MFCSLLVLACFAQCFAFDFQQRCLQRGKSFYYGGLCYQANNPAATSSPAAAEIACQQQGGQFHLALVRSADVVQGMTIVDTKYLNALPEQKRYYFIRAPNRTAMNYIGLNNSKSTDNQLSVTVTLGYRKNLIAIWYGQNPKTATLSDNLDKDYEGSFFCEIWPKFTQIGCDQTLSSNTSFVVQDFQKCTRQCSSYIWCAGVNFNSTTSTCQLLADNRSTKNLTENCGWSFFERS